MAGISSTTSGESDRAGARDLDPAIIGVEPLSRQGSRFVARRGHQLALEADGDRYVYLVTAGALFLQSEFPDGRRLIVNTYYRGDFIVPDANVQLPQERLMVMKSGDVVRFKRKVFDAAVDGSAELARHFRKAMELRALREEVHAVVLGRLTGDERMASYLIEAARVLGRDVNGTVDVELPLLRSEMADYLALNSDTLSRLVTRLRTDKVVTFIGRHRAIVEDWGQLLSRTPIADILLKAYPGVSRDE